MYVLILVCWPIETLCSRWSVSTPLLGDVVYFTICRSRKEADIKVPMSWPVVFGHQSVYVNVSLNVNVGVTNDDIYGGECEIVYQYHYHLSGQVVSIAWAGG